MEADTKSQDLFTHNSRVEGEGHEKRKSAKYNKSHCFYAYLLRTDGAWFDNALSKNQRTGRRIVKSKCQRFLWRTEKFD